MRFLWRLIFSCTMLLAALMLGGVAYHFYGNDNTIVAAMFAVLTVAALFHALRGPKRRPASVRGRRRKALVNFVDIDMDLYERAQNIPTSPNASPTKAQIRLAQSIGVNLPDHITASTAMDIIDDAIKF